jgi:hypothetical protein
MRSYAPVVATPVLALDGRPIGDGKPGPVTRQHHRQIALVRGHVDAVARDGRAEDSSITSCGKRTAAGPF